MERGRRSQYVSQTGRIYYNEIRKTEGECRVTCYWEASDEIKNIGDVEMAEQARILVLGLSPQMIIQHAWDLLPWSWLADWFSNFGDFLSLQNNTVASRSKEACVTYHTTSFLMLEEESNSTSGLTFQPYFSSLTTWQRHVTGALLFPSFNLPVLTGRQTLILASIAFNNGRR